MKQVLAIIRLRFDIARHALKTSSGVLDFAMGTLMLASGILLSLLAAAGTAVFSYYACKSSNPDACSIANHIIFWGIFIVGFIFPLFHGIRSQGFDHSRFLPYPVGRKTLYAVNYSAYLGDMNNLLYYPSLLALLIVAVLLMNAGPLGSFAIIVLFLLALTFWTNGLILFINGFMKSRKIRELAGIIFFLTFLGFSMMPVVLTVSEDQQNKGGNNYFPALFKGAATVAKHLPPSRAASGINALSAGNTDDFVRASGVLLLWAAGGMGAGYLFFARDTYTGRRVSPAGKSPTDKRLSSAGRLESFFLSKLGPEIYGSTVKELRYLFRSASGKLNLLAAAVLSLVFAFMFAMRTEAQFARFEPSEYVFMGLLIYTVMLENNFAVNAFAWEGEGTVLYFMVPAESRCILLGKNLALWLHGLLTAFTALAVWIIVSGYPGHSAIIAGFSSWAFVLISYTAAGNFISIMFPRSRDISSLMKSSPSQTGMLLSLIAFALLTAFIVVPVLLLSLATSLNIHVLFPPLLLLGMIFLYPPMLSFAGKLMDNRKEKLIETLGTRD